MVSAPATLGRFLPQFLRARGAPAREGYEEWALRGALLFVDVVGFTARVEKLGAQGPEGVELANGLLNDTIGQLVAELSVGGGDVAVFAGDGLFVLWPAAADEQDLAPAIARAADCALRSLALRRPDPQGTRPQLRFSLGASEFAAHRIGGHADNWHCLLSGAAFEQVGRCDALAQNDTLLVSPEACTMVAGRLIGRLLPGGVFEVRAVHGQMPPSTATEMIDCADDWTRRHVPEAVTHHLSQRDSRWLAEFRRPSTIFARLPGLLRGGQLDGARAHQATLTVQRIVAELEGTLLQFVIDDKGPVMIVAFGLAARVHEDDPARAALVALRIVQALSTQGIDCGVGVTTGRAFCGLIGSEQRCHYTLIGQTMNLAARLMQRAAPGPLFDERTRDLSRTRVDFVPEGEIPVKGLDAPVPHYRATVARGEPAADHEREIHGELVGRVRELDILDGQLDALSRERRGSLVVLVGEAGIGKSRLARELAARAARLGVLPLVAAAGAVESVPHSRWRPMLRALIEREAADPADRDPFLRAFMGPQRDSAPDVDDAERAFRTREAIARVVFDAARQTPVLLCIEDAHAMDSLSWSVVTRLAQGTRDAPLLLLLTTRELEASAPADALARLARAGLMRLPLGPLASEDRVRVAQAAVGASELSAAAAQWIGAHSGGNPLFCRELAVAAVESGRLRIVDGCAELAATGADSAEHLPDTLQGLIASRLDRLDRDEQVSLRMAAVIGVRFSADALLALRPGDGAKIRTELAWLQQRGLLDVDPDGVEGHYSFHHALVRDAAYDSLPYRLRRELHASFAAWLEQRFGDDLAPQAAALALHWERAENWPQAFEARLRAGDFAMQGYANREAVEHFTAAAKLRARVPALHAHPLASSAELGLARALHRMGDERASRAHIEQALRDVGEQLPQSRGSRLRGILRELLWRLLPHALRRPLQHRSPARLRAAVNAYDPLPELLYYDNDPLALVYVTLRFLRLAERTLTPTATHAHALGWMALLKSVLGSRAVARSFDHAIEVAEAAVDPAVDAWLRLARGSTLAQFGDWNQAERGLRDAQARYAAMGDRTRWWNATSGLGHVLAYRGELAASAAELAVALEANRDTDNPVFLSWGLSMNAEILHRLGDPDERGEVVRRLRAALAELIQRPDAAADLFCRALLAAALWRDDQRAEAFDLARETIDHALGRAPVVWLQVSAYLGLAEVLGEAGRDAAGRDEALRLLRRLERSLRGFARLIPVGRPALGLVRGQIEGLRGRPARAQAALRKALAEACRLGLPLEIGRLHLALAEVASPEVAAEQLDQAVAVFERIDARFDLGRARERRAALLRVLAQSQIATR